MTKVNKTSNTRETVYDRCAYVGCYNGKFINGRRLFHFPSETDRRLEMWIERSGNFRLRTWAATSLRKAGLCGDHFDEKCFTNATRKALRRNVVPRHYTEHVKSEKSNGEEIGGMNRNNAHNATVNFKEDSDNDSLNRLLSMPDKTTTMVQPDDSSSLSLDELAFVDVDKKLVSVRTPSPVVEFIVEELDEILLRDDESNAHEHHYCLSQNSSVNDSIFTYEKSRRMENKKSSECSGSSTALNEAKDPRDSNDRSLRVNRSDSDVRMYDVIRIKSESFSGRSETLADGEMTAMAHEKPRPRAIITDDNNCHIEHMLLKLQCDKRQLQKTVRTLRQKVRRAESRQTDLTNVRALLKNVDEFLDTQECTNPVARGMVKLALHKQNAPYTKEEKDFATQLYLQPSTVFDRLRASGCNLPGKSTVRRWIAEDYGQPLTCHFIKSIDAPDDDADDAGDGDVDENIRIDDIGELDDDVVFEETADQMEDQSDEVAQTFEEQIEDADEHEEYVNELPPDYDAEDYST